MCCPTKPGSAGKQRAGIRVVGRPENRFSRSLLSNHTTAQNDHGMREFANQIEVMANKKHAHPAGLLQAQQQIDDLTLHRDVERCGWLVSNQQAGLAGDRQRDHGALLLPPR